MSGFYDWPVDRQAAALADLARAALDHYDGVFGAPDLIKYRENAIFKVVRADGEAFALRIHRPGYHGDAALRSELAWMDALAGRGVPVPRIERTRSSAPLCVVTCAPVPEPRRVDLLGWLDGTSLGALEARGALASAQRSAHYRDVGSLLATLHDQAACWTAPSDFERPAWFAEALVGDEPNWGRFWELPALDAAGRAFMGEARAHLSRALRDYPRTPANSGLIHADLIADNVIVGPSGLRPIDFDDCGFGWHMFDIATALYFTREDADHAALTEALLDGYRSVRPLAEAEAAALPLFMLLRGTTYLGWVSTRAETPTARELTPDLIARCRAAARAYFARPAAAP